MIFSFLKLFFVLSFLICSFIYNRSISHLDESISTMKQWMSFNWLFVLQLISCMFSISDFRTNVQPWWAIHSSPLQKVPLSPLLSSIGLAEGCWWWRRFSPVCMQPWCTSAWTWKHDVSLHFPHSLHWTLDWWFQGEVWSVIIVSCTCRNTIYNLLI